MRRSAAATASADVSPAVSTNSQPRPRGSSGTAAAPRRARNTSTIRESMPSIATGWCDSRAGTASRGLGHARVAEHGQRHGPRRAHQAHRGAERPCRACPRCRRGTSPGRSRSPAAGAPGSSRTPAGVNRPNSVRMSPSRGATTPSRAAPIAPAAVPLVPAAARPSRPRRRASSRSPAAVSTSRPSTLSAVRPYRSAREPQALLPIIPPMLARECVDGSGPNRSPCPAAAAVMSSSIAPGWTPAVCASGSTPSTRFRCREKSSTRPAPTALPAIEVPAPRLVTGTPSPLATASAAAASSASRGNATTAGSTR